MNKYNSIKRYRGIGEDLQGKRIVITEKIDGANASFKLGEEGELLYFSRNSQLYEVGDGLRGFREWVKENIDVSKLIHGVTYFGEWNVPHKIVYKKENTKTFFLFDILLDDGSYGSQETVDYWAEQLQINKAPVLYKGEFISLDHINSFVGKSTLSENGDGEGVVVRCGNEKHKFISASFSEYTPKVKLGVSNSPLDEFIVATVNEARVSKIIMKLVDEGELTLPLTIQDTGKVLKALNDKVYKDVIKEEIEELLKVVKSKIGRKTPTVVKQVIVNMERAEYVK